MSGKIKSNGAEDVFITGNPQITFFKAVYRRHTNFAIEIKQHSSTGSPSTASDSVLTYKIGHDQGHLLHKMWVEAYLPAPNYNNPSTQNHSGSYINWTNNTGHAYIKECSFSIGGHLIDSHNDKWLDVYNELTDVHGSEHMGLNKHLSKNTYLRSNSKQIKDLQLSIPLQFWFCRNPGLALPLVALHKHDIKLKLTLRNPTELINLDGEKHSMPLQKPTVSLFMEVIHLDNHEIRRFSQNKHEYLIETLKYTEQDFSSNVKIVDFAHPVKEIIWVMSDSNKDKGVSMASSTTIDATKNISGKSNNDVNSIQGTPNSNDYFNYTCGTIDSFDKNGVNLTHKSGGGSNMYGTSDKYCEWFNTCVLTLDNTQRFAIQKAVYFRTTQPSQYRGYLPKKHVYSYSFALNPNDYTPSGTTNFSTIDNSFLKFTNVINKNSSVKIHIFGVCYNIFRIMSGMGSLIYSN